MPQEIVFSIKYHRSRAVPLPSSVATTAEEYGSPELFSPVTLHALPRPDPTLDTVESAKFDTNNHRIETTDA